MKKKKITQAPTTPDAGSKLGVGALVLRGILLVTISLILGFGIYSWNAKSLTGNMMPMPFGVGVAVVLSGSMEPVLSVDDLILVRAAEEYCVEDVVVYQSGNSLVVHEIVSIEGNTVVTRGRANNGNDEPITVDAIKGRVVLALPFVGMLVSFIRTPLVTVGLLLLAVWLLVRSYRAERRRDDAALDSIKEEIRRLKEGKDR